MNNQLYQTDSAHFENDVVKSELPVLVYFYSEDCPLCASVTPIINRMAEKYSGGMKFVRTFRQENRELAEKHGIKNSPSILFFKGGAVCAKLNGVFTNRELRNEIDQVLSGPCSREDRVKEYCDTLILGGGPAGMSAAIYTARARLRTIVIDEGLTGGQAATTFHIANYPGTNGVVRGSDLMENMKRQAMDFGAEMDDLKLVSEVKLSDKEIIVRTEDKDCYAKSLIIATGAEPRKLPADGEKEFRGRGVHYCAACDGALYQDADILVVGGGDSALQEAAFLTRYAKHVTIIHHSDYFKASKVLQDEAFNNPNISVVWDSDIKKIHGENLVKSVIIENNKTNEQKEIQTDGLFVYIGRVPDTALFKGIVSLDEYGYVLTDEDMKTDTEGIFAAGDVRKKKVRQISTAVGDGAIAGSMAERYVSGKP